MEMIGRIKKWKRRQRQTCREKRWREGIRIGTSWVSKGLEALRWLWKEQGSCISFDGSRIETPDHKSTFIKLNLDHLHPNLEASILSKPSLQDIPLLIALNKLDNLSSEVSNPSSASTSASWFEARLGKSLPNEVGRSRTVQGDSHSSNTASTQIEKKEPIPKIEDGSEEPKLQSRSWESVEASAWKK